MVIAGWQLLEFPQLVAIPPFIVKHPLIIITMQVGALLIINSRFVNSKNVDKCLQNMFEVAIIQLSSKYPVGYIDKYISIYYQVYFERRKELAPNVIG